MEEFFTLSYLPSIVYQPSTSFLVIQHASPERRLRSLCSPSIVHHLFTSFLVIHNKKLYATADIEGLLKVFNKRPR